MHVACAVRQYYVRVLEDINSGRQVAHVGGTRVHVSIVFRQNINIVKHDAVELETAFVRLQKPRVHHTSFIKILRSILKQIKQESNNER